MPSDGTMQIGYLYATQAEGTLPALARLVVTTPQTQHRDTIASYCSQQYFGLWYTGFGHTVFSNNCTGLPLIVGVRNTMDGFDRTDFIHVRAGDTVRFAYWAGYWANWVNVNWSETHGTVHLFGQSGCYSPDSIGMTVYLAYADSGFAKLDVKALRDTLIYGDTLKKSTPIAVIARSTLGREVKVPETMKVSLALSGLTAGNQYDAVLVAPNGDTTLSTLTNVAYSEARAGRVKIAAKIRPTVNVASFLIEASAQGKNGYDTVSLRRKLVYTPVNQGNPQWKDSLYDHTTKKIKDKGCALSCLVMVLNAWGDNVDLLTYQRWMNSSSGFDENGNVDFRSLNDYGPNNAVEGGALIDPKAISRQKGGTGMALTEMDPYLNDNNTVIAEVGHPVTVNGVQQLHTHFVIVYGKDSSGKYQIIDPDGGVFSTLDVKYDNTVYRAFLYH